jgi:hypothetical protein
MPEHDDTREGSKTDAELEASAEDDKFLDDLDPEEEEAAGVEGGHQMQNSAWSWGSS